MNVFCDSTFIQLRNLLHEFQILPRKESVKTVNNALLLHLTLLRTLKKHSERAPFACFLMGCSFSPFVTSHSLTIVAHSFHHDFSLGGLIAKATLARHFTGRIEVHLQLVGTQTGLHCSTSLLILNPCMDHMPWQVDPVCARPRNEGLL